MLQRFLPSLMLQQAYLFRRRNFQMLLNHLLNTHSKAFSQQQLPLFGVYPFEGDELDAWLDLEHTLNLKKPKDSTGK